MRVASNLIDISEAAQRLGVTMITLRRWDALGKLKIGENLWKS